jgi:hypothetical protein
VPAPPVKVTLPPAAIEIAPLSLPLVPSPPCPIEREPARQIDDDVAVGAATVIAKLREAVRRGDVQIGSRHRRIAAGAADIGIA